MFLLCRRHYKLFALIGLFTFISSSALAQQSISAIKNLPLGSIVTTTGTISTGAEFGVIRYMQDADAGIALYSSSLSFTQPGDSIIVTGQLSSYKGELQISPVMSYQLVASGKIIWPIIEHNFFSIQDPAFTGRLMGVFCVGISTCESKYAEGPYVVYDQFGNTAKMIVNSESSLIDKSIPPEVKAISGIWTSLNGQYQFLVQQTTNTPDIGCVLIPPAEVTYINNEVWLNWHNMVLTNTIVEWGENDFSNTFDAGTPGSHWSFRPPDLVPGKIYQSRILQILPSDTFYSPPALFAAPSAGPAIQVFFNRNVDTTFSDGSAPIATLPSSIQTNVISLIDQVSQTLDVAVYNAGSTLIIEAIKRAVNRGVQVRYITDDETSNTVLEGITSFPIQYRSGDGIMHNKFMIGDVDNPTAAWLWTGSTNWTIGQLTSDPNHAYILHDRALALNYKREFDELWGTGLNHADSRIGDAKTDNTAHTFSYNGIEIESYFSPSDEPDCHILQAISSANYAVDIGLLLLTSGTLIEEIIALHHQGIKVRVILEDESSSTYAVERLREEAVPLVIHDPSSIYHHKYAIIDEGYTESDPMVVTGSHNWTYSADHINDENTLIVHDQSFTNIFRQEFEARWKELYTSPVEENQSQSWLLFPNPARSSFQFSNPLNETCQLSLVNIHGQALQQFSVEANQTGNCPIGHDIPAGFYVIKITWPNHHVVTGLLINPD